MRSQAEIVERIGAIEGRDVLGFGRGALIDYLEFQYAQPFLNEGVTEQEWNEYRKTNPLDAIRAYMECAWEKAMNERGISAYRSLAKMEQWAWLSEDSTLMNLMILSAIPIMGNHNLQPSASILILMVGKNGRCLITYEIQP